MDQHSSLVIALSVDGGDWMFLVLGYTPVEVVEGIERKCNDYTCAIGRYKGAGSTVLTRLGNPELMRLGRPLPPQ